MNLGQLQYTEDEAKRFLLAVSELRKRCALERTSEASGDSPWFDPLLGSRESAAVRRASLDLSRALADLRKP